jgi:hypothetical protein
MLVQEYVVYATPEETSYSSTYYTRKLFVRSTIYASVYFTESLGYAIYAFFVSNYHEEIESRTSLKYDAAAPRSSEDELVVEKVLDCLFQKETEILLAKCMCSTGLEISISCKW